MWLATGLFSYGPLVIWKNQRYLSSINRHPDQTCQNVLASESPASSGPSLPNVVGLSSNCVKPTTAPVGPGASATSGYKVPEYFSFNRFSYAEAEVEMAKYRCPQPSALK